MSKKEDFFLIKEIEQPLKSQKKKNVEVDLDDLSKLSECGIDKVDYFLVISENLDTWKIFSNTDDNIFPIKTSKISYPLTFEVV